LLQTITHFLFFISQAHYLQCGLVVGQEVVCSWRSRRYIDWHMRVFLRTHCFRCELQFPTRLLQREHMINVHEAEGWCNLCCQVRPRPSRGKYEHTVIVPEAFRIYLTGGVAPCPAGLVAPNASGEVAAALSGVEAAVLSGEEATVLSGEEAAVVSGEEVAVMSGGEAAAVVVSDEVSGKVVDVPGKDGEVVVAPGKAV
jgi:hypothetical protein